MRGLTKEEAARLAKFVNYDPLIWGPERPEDAQIHERLYDRGSIADHDVPNATLITPLGKLALRVHQLCVERGLA